MLILITWLYQKPPDLIYSISSKELQSNLDYSKSQGPQESFQLIDSSNDLVGFVALRPKSTAMVIAGQSVHLTTLFPGQA